MVLDVLGGLALVANADECSGKSGSRARAATECRLTFQQPQVECARLQILDDALCALPEFLTRKRQHSNYGHFGLGRVSLMCAKRRLQGRKPDLVTSERSIKWMLSQTRDDGVCAYDQS